MKIMITATGPDLDSPVDPRFGRGAYFVLVDTETRDHLAVSNADGQDAGQGAGVQAAQKVAAAEAEALLTGHCGPKAHQVLSAAGIKVYNNISGTVNDAVESFLSGQLTAANGPDVEGHWA